MALHTKTIEYVVQGQAAQQAANTLLTFSSINIDIPETVGRTFKSCILVITYTSFRTTSTSSTTAPTASIKLGAATATNFTIGTDTGNGVTYIDYRPLEHWLDCTSHFVSNYSGTSLGCVITFQSPVATQSICAKVIITYEYDDSNTTRAKTVRIPLEGSKIDQTTSLVSVGSSTEIPNLSSFLPESSITYKDIFFEVQIATRNNGSDATHSVSLDAEAATDWTLMHTGGSTSGDVGFTKFFWKRTDMTTSATHDFKAKCSQASSGYEVAVVLVVTYTYDHSSSTRILNSIIVPFDIQGFGMQEITALANDLVYGCEVWVEEPGTITLLQSAVRINAGYQRTDNAGDQLRLKIGSQVAYTNYTSPLLAGFVTAWGITATPLQQRVDSGAASGQALTLARGRNLLNFSLYANGTFLSTYNFMVVTCSVLYLNYTSDKHAGGDGMHNRTIQWLGQADIYNGVIVQSSVGFTPSESNWWNNGFTPLFKVNEFDGIELRFQILPGEGLGDGWRTAASYVLPNWAPRYETQQATNRLAWDRYTNDADTSRSNPFSTRNWRMSGSPVTGISLALSFWITYHSITYTVSGNASGYTGGGSGITIGVHRSDTGELVGTSTTSAGGNYSFTWYDNVVDVYAEAQQDATHVGRSANNDGV